MKSAIDTLISVIGKYIGDRKLVLRWKNPAVEKAIYDALNIKPVFYVTRASHRFDNEESFSDEMLAGKSDEYYLVICPELKWNQADHDRYAKMGYTYKKDIFWLAPRSETVNANSSNFTYEDDFGNKINAKSKINVQFCGCNSSITIGENVIFPQAMIKVGNNVNLSIGSNTIISSAQFTFAEHATLQVGERVNIAGMFFSVNVDSTVIIGNSTTIQTGKLRTGRNQRVEIGNDCMFSWDITFIPHDGHLIWDVKTGKCTNNTTGPQRLSVKIGDHVWIGGETVFMPNTTVGSGSICGFRSLVRGTYPNNCILVGSPAKIVRKDIAWSRSNISFDDNDFFKIDEDFRQLTSEDKV
ncbi:MAG: acyltransferase [Oscillospiraceae bacterium]|nr:acyltransferase [Oscillospiraceae bacterium]MBQ7004430.1 acyltransferase [Oscillospiraceae bacterium]